ncbi:MAG: chemotaxis protein CheA [Deltaproteobacteria bacterium RIFOXYD12_FULL_50_9]|nr:MAG: chemotaxis protein CheA [Deltaproteobacteria bacterium RIFOXYD12_FULL_50_9]
MIDKDFGEIFREEATELLAELEEALLELESRPEDLALVSRVFRAMHTIKGSGAMFGFDRIADFTHHVETVFDKVRNGVVPVTAGLINQTLASRDHIKKLLALGNTVDPAVSAAGQQIIAAMQSMVAAGGQAKPAAPPVQPAAVENSGRTNFYIHFEPLPAFYDNGGDPEQLLDELRTIGEVTIFSDNKGQACTEFYDILLSTTKDLNAVKDLFIFVEGIVKYTVNAIEMPTQVEEIIAKNKKLGEILVDRGDVSKEILNDILATQKPIGELLVAADLVPRAKVESALTEQKVTSQRQQQLLQKAKCVEKESIRVTADKLDQLINLVGELVVTQARLTQIASGIKDAHLFEPVEEVERLTSELRDCVLNVRMIPIGSTFTRFRRLVRDLSTELGKDIEMVTEGAETELDKSMIDKLGDPLVHLIRNCIDHGIESPTSRAAAGKPAKGIVKLAAVHSGATVVVSVSDDGQGLDPATLRAKAIEKGIISSEAELSEVETFNLIFAPGFSTAKNVTSVSGRGVGMDVVRSAVEGLKGTVSLSSRRGQGTTVLITLPLTMAIIEGLLIQVGSTYFVLPQAQVEECVELGAKDIERFHGRHVFAVREHIIPYIRLRDFFEIEGERPELEQVVIVTNNGERLGLVLDHVVGGHQTVIKNLGWAYRNAQGVSGATILGNGEVALIIDVVDLARYALRDEAPMVQ